MALVCINRSMPSRMREVIFHLFLTANVDIFSSAAESSIHPYPVTVPLGFLCRITLPYS